jgi:hypothetical protein
VKGIIEINSHSNNKILAEYCAKLYNLLIFIYKILISIRGRSKNENETTELGKNGEYLSLSQQYGFIFSLASGNRYPAD